MDAAPKPSQAASTSTQESETSLPPPPPPSNIDLNNNAEEEEEKAWTLEEMEEVAKKNEWKLEADIGFFHFLKDFSERIFEKTRETQRELEGLISELDSAETQVNNAFGALDVLCLNQFVERRIEEQEPEVPKTDLDEDVQMTQQEAVRQYVIPKFTSAFQITLNSIKEKPLLSEVTNPLITIPFIKPIQEINDEEIQQETEQQEVQQKETENQVNETENQVNETENQEDPLKISNDKEIDEQPTENEG